MYSFADYDDENHALDNGYIHEDDLPDLDSARDFITGIQECVYQSGDVDKLEGYLEELCAIMDCRFLPQKRDDKPKLRKDDRIQWFLGYQRASMDQNLNTGRSLRDYKICMKENNNV